MSNKEKMVELIKQLNIYNHANHNLDEPLVSDRT